MTRLDQSEKKRVALAFIEKIKAGYRLTGPNKAFTEVLKENEGLAINQASIYQFIRGDEALSSAYFQARDESRKCVLSGSSQMGIEKRKELLKLVIENMAKGMNIRGDTFRANAIAEACKELEIPLVHWATVHRWLRTEHKDLQASYRAAMKESKNVQQ